MRTSLLKSKFWPSIKISVPPRFEMILSFDPFITGVRDFWKTRSADNPFSTTVNSIGPSASPLKSNITFHVKSDLQFVVIDFAGTSPPGMRLLAWTWIVSFAELQSPETVYWL